MSTTTSVSSEVQARQSAQPGYVLSGENINALRELGLNAAPVDARGLLHPDYHRSKLAILSPEQRDAIAELSVIRLNRLEDGHDKLRLLNKIGNAFKEVGAPRTHSNTLSPEEAGAIADLTDKTRFLALRSHVRKNLEVIPEEKLAPVLSFLRDALIWQAERVHSLEAGRKSAA